MTSEECELIGHHGFVLRAVVDVEVIDARIGAQLTVRRAPSGFDGGGRLGHLVRLTYTHQPGAVKGRRVTDRTVRLGDEPRRGDPIAPARVLTDRYDVAPSRLAVGGVDQRRFARLPDCREELPSLGGGAHLRGQIRRRSEGLAARVEQGHLADRRGYAIVPAAAARAFPPPIDDPNVTTPSAWIPASERAKAIAARQSAS